MKARNEMKLMNSGVSRHWRRGGRGGGFGKGPKPMMIHVFQQENHFSRPCSVWTVGVSIASDVIIEI